MIEAALPLGESIGKKEKVTAIKGGIFAYLRITDIAAINKIYVWSVVFEPLLFFILWDEWTTGVGGNLSRILQAIVIFALLLRFFVKSSGALRVINFANPLYRNYGIYLAIVIFAGLLGATMGIYNIDFQYSSVLQSSFANWLNSPAVRPLFEYVIAIYYFIYFMVMPRYMLKTESALQYFFSAFRTMFIISFVLGIIGFAFEYFGVRLLPCHIANWPQWAGVRFHGLAGEPRHAFVYLFLGLAVFNIEAYISRKSLSKSLIIMVIAAAFLTQSASGLIGIAVFLILLSLDSLTDKINGRHIFLLLGILTLTTLLIYGVIISSTHLSNYLASASDLWSILESGGKLPYFLMVQSADIYPLYDLLVKARELNILPVLIGSGLGSASAINNIYTPFAAGQMINPNSQLVRSFFESGIVGTFFFILSFIYPVKRLTRQIPAKARFTFIILTWLLIGCFMGVRSAAPFIYLGIFLAVFAPYCKTNKWAVP